MAGHIPSAALIVNVIMNRAKLVAEFRESKSVSSSSRTVVVPNDDAGYLASLQAAAEDSRPAQ
jgi:hypothetical protein